MATGREKGKIQMFTHGYSIIMERLGVIFFL